MFLSQGFLGLDHGVGPCSITAWVLSEFWQHLNHSDHLIYDPCYLSLLIGWCSFFDLFRFIIFKTLLIVLLEQSNWSIEGMKTRYCCEVSGGWHRWLLNKLNLVILVKEKTHAKILHKFHKPLSSNFNSHYSILFINFVGILNFILMKMKFEENSGCDRPQCTWSAGLGICFHDWIIW